MREAIRLVGIIICLILGGSSEGMTLPLQSTLDNLIEKHRDKLSRSKVYIAVTVHNQKPFISNLRQTLEANVSELTRYGVKSHAIITCDGIKEDFEECKKQFNGFKNLKICFKKRDDKRISDAGQRLLKDAMKSEGYTDADFFPVKLELIKRSAESRVGVSLARWNQLSYIHELIKENEKNNLLPYFFIFDGDDVIHKDLLLIELLALLETGADAASPGNYFHISSDIVKNTASSGNILRCKYEDSPEILKRASMDIDECLIDYCTESASYAFNLFDGRVLKRVLQEGYKLGFDENARSINPERDFMTLEPFYSAVTKAIDVFLLNVSGEQKYQTTENCYDPRFAPFFNKENKQNTLFYYMQHDDSLEGTRRKIYDE